MRRSNSTHPQLSSNHPTGKSPPAPPRASLKAKEGRRRGESIRLTTARLSTSWRRSQNQAVAQLRQAPKAQRAHSLQVNRKSPGQKPPKHAEQPRGVPQLDFATTFGKNTPADMGTSAGAFSANSSELSLATHLYSSEKPRESSTYFGSMKRTVFCGSTIWHTCTSPTSDSSMTSSSCATPVRSCSKSTIS